ncbi:hypothetical protein CpMEX2_03660 [Corynebacterium pseudotuberculosis]|uniref:hypothetical protein n=1 Tax=Corynebacterium pseudotuberculosis TaxID=1719 RepID=UPI0006BB72E6|nr:hypothetical protein AN902_03610 [Corynebacterium pseudotuberculosis]ANH25546.1 Hypothetical protein CpMEX9_0748 [Corynebacterium pseudotuberculosis]APZ31500.1 Hypothetical protein CpMEX1_0744 [Corynebacterium pseudotuberculosis]QGX60151.1 hypothetical protein CpMEX2_03660 [Corynebacterium pseudotuberculosis]
MLRRISKLNTGSLHSILSRRAAIPRLHHLVIYATIGALSVLVIPDDTTAQPGPEYPLHSDTVTSVNGSSDLFTLMEQPTSAEHQSPRKEHQPTWTKIMVAPGKSKTIPIKEYFFDSPVCTAIKDADNTEPIWITQEPSNGLFSEIFRVHVPTTAHLGDTHSILVYRCGTDDPANTFTFEITVSNFDQDVTGITHSRTSAFPSSAEPPRYYDNSDLLWLSPAVIPLILLLCAITFWSLTRTALGRRATKSHA